MQKKSLAVPAVVLLAAAVAFLAVWRVSPDDAPIALAIPLLVAACGYDLRRLSIPTWIFAALVGSAAAYHAALWAGLLPVPPWLGAALGYLPAPPVFILLPFFGALVAGLAVYFISIGLAAAGTVLGEHDAYLAACLGALVPVRALPNLQGVSPIFFVPSAVLNAVVLGSFLALALGVARRWGKRNRGGRPSPLFLGLGRRYWSGAVLAVLCVAALWLVCSRALSPFPLDLSGYYWGGRYEFLSTTTPLILTGAWLGIFSLSLLLLHPRVFPAGLLNGVLVVTLVPRIVPLPSEIDFIPVMILFFVALAVFVAVRDFVELRWPGLDVVRGGLPFAPAILFGFLLSALWGDFLTGFLAPALRSGWWVL